MSRSPEETQADKEALENEIGNKEIATTFRQMNVVRIDDSTLRSWQNIEDALNEFEQEGMPVYLAHEVIGSGYQVTDKKDLVNIGMLLVNWRFTHGEQGDFVVVTAITKESPVRRVIFTDGSTGVRNQLMNETKRRAEMGIPHLNAGLLVNKGLVDSEYDVDIEDPKTGEVKQTKAHTFYLSTSA